MAESESSSELNIKRMLSLVLSPSLFNAAVVESKADVKQQSSTKVVGEPEIETFAESNSTATDETTFTNVLKKLKCLEDPTLVVTIGSFAFNVNIEVLEIYSEYFKERSDTKLLNLPEEQVSLNAFVAIYEWMLSDKPSLPRKGIVELYKAAAFLEIPEFLAQFWKCISNPFINEDNAFLMYLEALAFEAPIVRKVMLGRISRFFLPLVACEEFLHLPVDDLFTLLKSNAICVNSEIEVYFACVRFFNFDWESRSQDLLPVMKLIRLDFLPTEFILELLNSENGIDVPEVMRLMDHSELQDKLRDLMHYHCLTAFPGPNLVPLMKSNQRSWIYDYACEYHDTARNEESRQPSYVKYSVFCDYLKFLCQAGPKYWEGFKKIKIFDDFDSDVQSNVCEIVD